MRLDGAENRRRLQTIRDGRDMRHGQAVRIDPHALEGFVIRDLAAVGENDDEVQPVPDVSQIGPATLLLLEEVNGRWNGASKLGNAGRGRGEIRNGDQTQRSDRR